MSAASLITQSRRQAVNHSSHMCKHVALSTVRLYFTLLAAVVFVEILVCVYLSSLRLSDFALFAPPPVGLRRNFITVQRVDRRLGNRMFEYAAMLGIARANNLTPLVPADYKLRSVFTLSSAESGQLQRFYVTFDEFGHRSSAYDLRSRHLQPDYDYMLSGYFQSWMYFSDASAAAAVRADFRFNAHVDAAARAFHVMHLRTDEFAHRPLVALHVRRGDMTSSHLRDYGYTVAPASYVSRARRLLVERLAPLAPLFVVSGDDPAWVRKHVTGSDVVYAHHPAQPFLDMAILARCQHSIITVGSFGWWVGWLVNGTTVYYKNWPRPNSILEYMVTKKHYFPPHWVPLGD